MEYGKLLRLNRLLSLEEYQEWQEKEKFIGHGYPIFFRIKHKTWAGHLIGCPFCLMAFLSVILSSWTLIFCPIIGLATAAIGSLVFMAEVFIYEKIWK